MRGVGLSLGPTALLTEPGCLEPSRQWSKALESMLLPDLGFAFGSSPGESWMARLACSQAKELAWLGTGSGPSDR